MRAPVLAAAALVLAWSPVARADDAKPPKEVIARAITAAGGKDDGRPVRMTWKDAGTISIAGMKFEYTADWWFRSPDALRYDVAVDVMGQKLKVATVVNGDTVWDVADGKTAAATGDKKEYSQSAAYQLWVASLAPLNHDKAFKLQPVVGKKVNDKPTTGVLVERKDRPVVTLYFDNETGLLVMSEMLVKDEFQGWKEVPEEAYYEDWKDAGGRKVFTAIRVVRDGKPLIESKLSDLQLPEKIDPKVFEKP
jgi:hypothetical protein